MHAQIILIDPTLVVECRETLLQWQEEHERYYGRPHGATVIPARNDVSAALLHDHDRGRCGYASLIGEGGRWLTSGGNVTAVTLYQNGTAHVLVTGRRHGIRWPFDTAGLTLADVPQGTSSDAAVDVLDASGRVVGRVVRYDTQADYSAVAPWATDVLVPGLTPADSATAEEHVSA